jgi:hypothetical protein
LRIFRTITSPNGIFLQPGRQKQAIIKWVPDERLLVV